MATVVFALPRAVPGDPLDQLISDDTSTIVDPSEREQLAEHYGLDQPMVTQYGRFLGGVITGDLGWSLSKHDDVRSVVVARLPWTLLLVGPALALSTLLGFVAGLVAAWGHGRRVDRVLVGLFALLRSIPDFVIATVVLLAFAVWLPWFPVAGARTPFRSGASWWSDAGDISRHAVLPVVALTLALVGTKFVITRAAMVSVLGREFLVAARAKGLSTYRVRYVHGARHTLAPVLAHVGAQVSFAIAGAVFVENVFAYPGLGSLTLDAMGTRDYPLLDGCFITLGAVVLLSNALVDIVVRRLSPWGTT